MDHSTTQPDFHHHQSNQPIPTELYRRPAADGQVKVGKRPRASRPKVKTGCITCKARRVKCSEEKPYCLRCQKFGRTCDGYSPEPRPHVHLMPLQPRLSSADIHPPNTAIRATDEESQYFRVYIERTAHELPGYFDSDFYNRIVLQECYRVPPIRQAVIAIGALSKSLESAPVTALKVNVIQSSNHQRHYEFAVTQYLKAIRTLNGYISQSNDSQIRTALIACLLFVSFEALQGSYPSSIQQIHGGLKLLRSYYAGKLDSKPWIPQPLEHNDPFPYANTGGDFSDSNSFAAYLEEYFNLEDRSSHSHRSESFTNPATLVSEPLVYDSFPGQVAPPLYNINEQQMNMAHVSVQNQSNGHTGNEWTGDYLTKPTPFLLDHHNVQRLSPQYFSRKTSSTISTPPSTRYSTPSPPYTPGLAAQLHPTPYHHPSVPQRGTSPTPQNNTTIEDTIIRTLVRADNSGIFFGVIPGITALIWDIQKYHNSPIPSSFPNLLSAESSWDFLMGRVLQFCSCTLYNRTSTAVTNDNPSEASQSQSYFFAQLSSFAQAYQPILDSAFTPDGTILNHAAALISLYQKITFVTLAAVCADSETIYDNFTPEFEYIIRTSSLLISSTSFQRYPRFSAEAGIIPPLHVTAMKCREPRLRRQAIELLLKNPRQEGMWDSILCARMAGCVIHWEEGEGCLPIPGPDFVENGEQENGYNFSSPPPGEQTNLYASNLRASWNLNAFHGDLDLAGLNISTNQRGNTGTQGTVPEENRMRLVAADFYMRNRYLNLKCRRAVEREGNEGEIRERILAW